MALGAATVGNGGKANRAPVLNVARTASGSERLMLIVGRCIVTSEACAIRDGRAKIGSADVA